MLSHCEENVINLYKIFLYDTRYKYSIFLFFNNFTEQRWLQYWDDVGNNTEKNSSRFATLPNSGTAISHTPSNLNT